MPTDSLRLPPLTALKCFYVLGKAGSLRRAAAELNVTHTAVVRQIRQLESWLGAALVETSASGTVLNPQGVRYHRTLCQAFEMISGATAEIRPPGQTEELRVCAPPGFATFWVLPRLHEIQRRMPNVAFDIIPMEARKFDKNSFDIEVSYGHRDDPELVNIPLVRPRLMALASPAWIAAHPQVKTAQDLMGVSLVHERFTDVWRSWFEALGFSVGQLQGPRLGALTTVLEAVHLDQGPGLFADIFVDERLTRGVLHQVVPDMPRAGTYVLVLRKDRADEPAIRRFSDWLIGTLDSARDAGGLPL